MLSCVSDMAITPSGSIPVLSGLLLVNKPSGPTSYDMIRRIKRLVKPNKIGHSGTLDPLASGLLILLIGRATKLQSVVMGQKKVYRCRMKWGIKTDTADISGKVIATSETPLPSQQEICRVFESFLGAQSQIPPMFSALKKDGQPLYKLARNGEVVERKPRSIEIDSLDLLGCDDDIEFRVKCSSGTYVRTLVEDIAAALGGLGTMSGLVRENIGNHGLEDAIAGELLPTLTIEVIQSRLIAQPA